MDKRVPVSYYDPEKLIVYAPSLTHPSPYPSPSPYPPSPISSRSSASIRSYAWNPALFAVDRNKRLAPQPILTYWRTKKRAAIGITILVFVVVAGIIAGITVGVLERQHTSLAASIPNNVSSSFNNTPSPSNNTPPPTPPPAPPTQETSPRTQLNSTVDDAILTGLQVAEAFNNNASWIWSVGGADFDAPGGSVVFSKTLPMGKANATTALVLLAADDECQLYINGKMVADKTSPWDRVILLSVPLDPGPNMFAINATNYGSGGNPAGLRVSAQITYADNSTTVIWSNATWRTFQPPPEGFAMQNINDTDWEDAVVLDGSVWAEGMVMPTNFTTTTTT